MPGWDRIYQELVQRLNVVPRNFRPGVAPDVQLVALVDDFSNLQNPPVVNEFGTGGFNPSAVAAQFRTDCIQAGQTPLFVSLAQYSATTNYGVIDGVPPTLASTLVPAKLSGAVGVAATAVATGGSTATDLFTGADPPETDPGFQNDVSLLVLPGQFAAFQHDVVNTATSQSLIRWIEFPRFDVSSLAVADR